MGDPFAHYKELPFFEGSHADLCHRVAAWAEEVLGKFPHGHPASEAACREMVRSLGQAGWLAYTVGGKAYGGVEEGIGVRAVSLIREVLAYHSGLAEFAFAMQGLGSGPITLYGTPEQKRRYLPRVAAGEAVAAFALSEPGAGSDAAALTCRAYLDGEAFVLEGEKAWVSNGESRIFMWSLLVWSLGREAKGSAPFWWMQARKVWRWNRWRWWPPPFSQACLPGMPHPPVQALGIPRAGVAHRDGNLGHIPGYSGSGGPWVR